MLASSATKVAAASAISSSPSAPWTTGARRKPSAPSAGDRLAPPPREHADDLMAHAAGLVSGPSRLKIVRGRAPCAARPRAGRRVKARREREADARLAQALRRHAPATTPVTPSASSTSAAPHFDDSARLPCFGSRTPARGDQDRGERRDVDRREPSPPVPQVSIVSVAHSTAVARLRIAGAAPTARRLSPFRAAPHEQPADLRGRRLAVHDLADDLGHLGARQVLAVDDRAAADGSRAGRVGWLTRRLPSRGSSRAAACRRWS